MNLEIKKNLASNWFRLLQNAVCDNIIKLEGKKTKFNVKLLKIFPVVMMGQKFENVKDNKTNLLKER